VAPVERLGIMQEHSRKTQLHLLNLIVLMMKMMIEVNKFVVPRHFGGFGDGLRERIITLTIIRNITTYSTSE
jgi:hypothetical protein